MATTRARVRRKGRVTSPVSPPGGVHENHQNSVRDKPLVARSCALHRVVRVQIGGRAVEVGAQESAEDGGCALRERAEGDDNERPDVSPNDGLDKEWAWTRIELRVGDVMYLTSGWWHYVESVPHTVMTNYWKYSKDR